LSAPLYIARTVRRYAQPRICLHNSSSLLSFCFFESSRSFMNAPRRETEIFTQHSTSSTAAPILSCAFIFAIAHFLFSWYFIFFSALDGIYHSTPYNSLRRPKLCLAIYFLFYIAHNVRSFFLLFLTRFTIFLRSILFQSTNSPPNSALGGNL